MCPIEFAESCTGCGEARNGRNITRPLSSSPSPSSPSSLDERVRAEAVPVDRAPRQRSYRNRCTLRYARARRGRARDRLYVPALPGVYRYIGVLYRIPWYTRKDERFASCIALDA